MVKRRQVGVSSEECACLKSELLKRLSGESEGALISSWRECCKLVQARLSDAASWDDGTTLAVCSLLQECCKAALNFTSNQQALQVQQAGLQYQVVRALHQKQDVEHVHMLAMALLSFLQATHPSEAMQQSTALWTGNLAAAIWASSATSADAAAFQTLASAVMPGKGGTGDASASVWPAAHRLVATRLRGRVEGMASQEVDTVFRLLAVAPSPVELAAGHKLVRHMVPKLCTSVLCDLMCSPAASEHSEAEKPFRVAAAQLAVHELARSRSSAALAALASPASACHAWVWLAAVLWSRCSRDECASPLPLASAFTAWLAAAADEAAQDGLSDAEQTVLLASMACATAALHHIAAEGQPQQHALAAALARELAAMACTAIASARCNQWPARVGSAAAFALDLLGGMAALLSASPPCLEAEHVELLSETMHITAAAVWDALLLTPSEGDLHSGRGQQDVQSALRHAPLAQPAYFRSSLLCSMCMASRG
jgi:hypothetical protein